MISDFSPREPTLASKHYANLLDQLDFLQVPGRDLILTTPAGDQGRIRVSEASGRITRRHLLWRLAEHIMEGPNYVVPAHADGGFLVPSALLKQYRPSRAIPFQVLTLYKPDNSYIPARSLPLVKHLTWNWKADVERSRVSFVEVPEIEVRYFQVEREELEKLERDLESLIGTLTDLYDARHSFEFASLYQDPMDEPYQGGDTGPSFVRQVHMFAMRFSLLLSFRSTEFPGVNLAWESVWRRLEALCEPSKRVVDLKENYSIRPELFADTLRREADLRSQDI